MSSISSSVLLCSKLFCMKWAIANISFKHRWNCLVSRLKPRHSRIIFKVNKFYSWFCALFQVSIIELFEVVGIKFKVRFQKTKKTLPWRCSWLHVIHPLYTISWCKQVLFNGEFVFIETIKCFTINWFFFIQYSRITFVRDSFHTFHATVTNFQSKPWDY